MEYCSHIWGGAPRSHGLDLLDRVLKRVVRLISSGLSSDLQALSHRMLLASACSTSFMGNVPLSLWMSYLSKVSLLEALAFLSRCIIIQLSLLCAGLSFINHPFFRTQQPFGTPSLMNAFHQITISQYSSGGLTSSCC